EHVQQPVAALLPGERRAPVGDVDNRLARAGGQVESVRFHAAKRKFRGMAQGRNRYSVISDGLPSQIPDVDPAETQEWLESLDGVIDSAGPRRARFLMLKLLERARERQVGVPALRSTDYV